MEIPDGGSPAPRRAGRRIRRVLSDPEAGQRTGDLCFSSRGFSLHAARRVRADQRGKLEELLRDVLRPPFANSHLRWIDDGTLLLALKRTWSNGTTHLLFSPAELTGRPAAIVPPMGFNGLRYHGVLAPRSRLRSRVVLSASSAKEIVPSDVDDAEAAQAPSELISPATPSKRILWADLLRRVFCKDVDHCDCGGQFRLPAFITDPMECTRYLEHQGLTSDAPEIAPARAPSQTELDFDIR